MSTPRKIAYNVVFSATAKMVGTVLALVGIGFITRYLGAGGFGDYSTVLAFFFFFGALADLGLYSISTREISRPGSNEKEILGNVFAIRYHLLAGHCCNFSFICAFSSLFPCGQNRDYHFRSCLSFFPRGTRSSSDFSRSGSPWTRWRSANWLEKFFKWR